MLRKMLDRMGMLEQEKSFNRMNLQMLEFSSAFSTITDVNQLVPTAIGKIRDMMGVKEAALFLVDDAGDRFDLAFHRNIVLNPKLRLRGDYYFDKSDKFVRWLHTNRRPFLMSEMSDVFAYLPEEERDILRFINAEMALGLEAHNRFIGILSLGRRIDGKDFDETDSSLLQAVAAQAALAIQNNRLQQKALEQMRVKRELEIAGEIQRRLLPNCPPSNLGNLELCGICIPSTEVGGDYFDFLELEDNKLGLVIGDVAGHGLGAGFLMGMAKTCVDIVSRLHMSADAVLQNLNEMIYNLDEKTALMTGIYGIVDKEANTFTFSNAGHIYPYYYNASEDRIIQLETESYPLGVRKEQDFPVRSVKLEHGDFILMCSDGFIEATNKRGKFLGYDKFEETVFKHRDNTADDIARAIREDFFNFLSGAQHKDDLTLLVLRLKR